MSPLLVVACGDVCSCITVIISLGALAIAILAWRVAKKQLTDSVNGVKTANSLEILSWFDDKEIRDVLREIYEENQDIQADDEDDRILSLLFILDTACTLIKTGNYDKKLLSQMHEDFEQININHRVLALLNSYRARFPHLDIQWLVDETMSTHNEKKRSTRSTK